MTRLRAAAWLAVLFGLVLVLPAAAFVLRGLFCAAWIVPFVARALGLILTSATTRTATTLFGRRSSFE